VAYALVGRQYQTGMTFRARLGPYRDVPEEGVHLRGMQTFAYGDEMPILFHGRDIVSTTRVGQTDTCVENVLKTVVLAQNGLDMVCEYRAGLKTLYVFTPTSVVVIHKSDGEMIRSFWSLFESDANNIALDRNGHVVAFSGRIGRVYYLAGRAELYAHEEGDEKRWMLDVIADSSMSAFAFSDASFSFDMLTSDVFKFSDVSGVYEMKISDLFQ